MASEIIKRTLLTGQLAEQSREDRSDQGGLAIPILAHNCDWPLPKQSKFTQTSIGNASVIPSNRR